jgi:hypothetical protein
MDKRLYPLSDGRGQFEIGRGGERQVLVGEQPPDSFLARPVQLTAEDSLYDK